ncbi:MAG: Uma2 family endonuclease, partial [Blastocatellia bacterium]
MTDEEFFALCQSNETVLFEREPKGTIVERPLAGWQTSLRSVEVTRQLGDWVKRDGSGMGFGALTGFALPNGAVRGPYAAWVLRSRIESLAAEQKKGFLPLSPDFVVELVSDSADLSYFHKKMAEYVSCGSRLGWLIDPETRTVRIYRPNVAVEELKDVAEVSADPELPGFVLDSTVYGPHYDPGVVYYINEIARQGLKTFSEKKRFPVGSIIVKEKQERRTEDSVQIITVMKKAYAGSGEDSWDYKMYDTRKWTEVDLSKQKRAFLNSGCIECHRRYKKMITFQKEGLNCYSESRGQRIERRSYCSGRTLISAESACGQRRADRGESQQAADAQE